MTERGATAGRCIQLFALRPPRSLTIGSFRPRSLDKNLVERAAMSGAARRGSQAARRQWANIMQWQGKFVWNGLYRKKKLPRSMSIEIPESKEFYDTPNLKIGLGMVVVAVLAKLTMMYDESKEEERTERRARELAEAQEGASKMVSKEMWEELQQFRPRTPFESRVSRENARIRTGDATTLEDVKDWAIDVLTEALLRKEDSL